jgi:hypothetical protein
MKLRSTQLACLLALATAASAPEAHTQPLVTATVYTTFRVSSHPDSLLQGVVDVTPMAGGQVVVVDALAQNVKVFDSTGVLRRIIGRRGAGPGEFGALFRAMPTADGRVMIPGAAQIQIFTPSGNFVSSLPVAPIAELPLGFNLGTDGTVYVATMVFTGTAAATPPDLSALPRITRQVDSIVRVRTWKDGVPAQTLMLSTGAQLSDIVTLGASSIWSGNSSGTMVVSGGARPHFRVYTVDGRLVREIATPATWRPIPTSDADVQVLMDKYGESLPPDSRTMVVSMLRRMPVAAEYPAYVAVILTDDNHIWAQPPVTAAVIREGRVQTYDLRQNYGSAEWHVYSPGGALLARVRVPDGFHLRRVIGDLLYGDALNSDDEPIVQILRVVLPR